MDHVYILRAGTHYNKRLQSDFSKYGESDFSFSIVEECRFDDLKECEEKHINSRNRETVYNRHFSSNTGASAGELSNESRLRMSQRQLGENNHFYGKKHSEETKKRMSESASLRRAKRKKS